MLLDFASFALWGLLPRVTTVLLLANRHESHTGLFCAQWLQISPDRPQDLPGKVLLMWPGPSPWQQAFLPCHCLDFDKTTNSRKVFIPRAQQKSKSLPFGHFQSYLPEVILNYLKVQSTLNRAMEIFYHTCPYWQSACSKKLACEAKKIWTRGWGEFPSAPPSPTPLPPPVHFFLRSPQFARGQNSANTSNLLAVINAKRLLHRLRKNNLLALDYRT